MTEQPTRRIVVFGEVLFDCFPDGTRALGGAPFNVAWHLHGFGCNPLMISRVGEDEAGSLVLDRMKTWGMDTSGIERDNKHPTGCVQVHMQDGQPSYDIVPDQAYDHIEGKGIGPTPPPYALLYHGTLALRSPASRNALLRLREALQAPVFLDINLRPPWWDAARVGTLLDHRVWLKLNGDELRTLGEQLPCKTATGDTPAQHVIERFGLKGMVLTHGAEGAEIILPGADARRVEAAPIRQRVDTVGAGDAFSAVTLLGLTAQWPAAKTLERANAFAATVCEQQGALIEQAAHYHAFLEKWRSEDA